MGIGELAKSVCHVERNLKMLADMPRITLGNIRDFRGAFKKRKVLRGSKTQGKGHKGQGQRGTKPRIGFEGGQTPFYRLVPKKGSLNKRYVLDFAPINLNRIQYFIDSKRIDPNQKIDIGILYRSGAITDKIKDGVELLSEGSTWFQANIDIEVTRASQEAIQTVERNGGTVKAVFYDQSQLRIMTQPDTITPKLCRPNNKLILWYADPINRGFLADPDEVERLREENVKLGKVTDLLTGLRLSDDGSSRATSV